MEGIDSHQVVLAEFVARSGDGPVLELGMGDGSTPLLHELCKGRVLVSVENDPEWFEKFIHYAADGGHRLVLVADWRDTIPVGRWALAFIDHTPGEARAASILALRDSADFIVVHDTERGAAHLYPGVAEALATFPHRKVYHNGSMQTTVVSMVKEP